MQFEAIANPPDETVERVGALAPCNPFNNRLYVAAQRDVGRSPIAFVLNDGSDLIAGCIGYMGGRIPSRTLEITSIADLPPDSPDAEAIFWHGLMTFCATRRVVHLDIASYGTRWLSLPHLPEQDSRRSRAEYVLNLEEPLPKPSSNHKRNITRAQKAGVQVRRTRDSVALAEHVSLMGASMERREQRGESVPTVHPSPFDSALLRCGAADLFQAHDGSSLLSSILVLRAPSGAYYQSAGTSPEGMEIGASQFLISSVACLLQHDGMHLFNLGGAGDESPGLQRFKSGFGAHPVPLEAASFVFGSRGERAARSLVARALGAASLPFRKTRSSHRA